ncbi:MAG: hypothetical protein WBD99_16900 [Thermodesulfobacteriota bacterium]
MINQHHNNNELLGVVIVFVFAISFFFFSKMVHAEELSQGQRQFQKILKSKNETPEHRTERAEETKSVKKVAQEMTQEQKIEELERKLNAVTKELQDLKTQGLPEERLKSIEEKISVLAEEIDNIKSAAIVEEPTYEQVFGMGPAASKVYKTDQGISIGGYGEIIGQFQEDRDNTLDTQRAVMYFGYKFNDRIIFNSEIEFEHATTDENLNGQAGEVSVEFSYLDFLLTEAANLRGGLVLAPFGIINEVHEPTTFFGVLRPDVERFIIPTTWREVGAGLFGGFSEYVPGELTYKAYVMDSFDSRGFTASSNRGARQNGNRALANNVAFVGRMEYDPFPGLKFGGSLFLGNTGQDQTVDNPESPLNGEKIGGFFQMYEGDVQVQYRGFEGRSLLVWTFLDDVSLINANNGFTGDESVGSQQWGWYIVGAYNVLSLANFGQYFQYFAPFVRYEKYNTQHRVPSGFFTNPANDRQSLAFGINYKPIPQVVIKADYRWNDNEAGTGQNEFNLGLGYVF